MILVYEVSVEFFFFYSGLYWVKVLRSTGWFFGAVIKRRLPVLLTIFFFIKVLGC